MSVAKGVTTTILTEDQTRPVIEENRIYTRPEAAQACGVHVITLVRAYGNGNLKAYRIGRRVVHSGKHLRLWLESGGCTQKVTSAVVS